MKRKTTHKQLNHFAIQAVKLFLLAFTIYQFTFIEKSISYYQDIESSNKNTSSAGTLIAETRAGQSNFSPQTTALDLKKGESVARDIYFRKTGTLDFEYSIDVKKEENCNQDLFENLDFTLYYNYYHTQNPADSNYHQYRTMSKKYSGKLSDFKLDTNSDFQIPNEHEYFENLFYEGNEHWFYAKVTLPEDADDNLSEKSCSFDLVFSAKQKGNENGFSDQKRISSTIQTADWEKADVVLNEILPNPEGDDDQDGADGEWVEFYNRGDAAIDLSGWYIKDASNGGNKKTISSNNTLNNQTIIGAKGSGDEWVVLFLSDSMLNNSGEETVYFYDKDDNLIDEYTFDAKSNDSDDEETNSLGTANEDQSGTSNSEGKSFVRYPDGAENWIDPVPTLGSKNTDDNNKKDYQEYYEEICFDKNGDEICDIAFMYKLGLIELEKEDTPVEAENASKSLENLKESLESNEKNAEEDNDKESEDDDDKNKKSDKDKDDENDANAKKDEIQTNTPVEEILNTTPPSTSTSTDNNDSTNTTNQNIESNESNNTNQESTEENSNKDIDANQNSVNDTEKNTTESSTEKDPKKTTGETGETNDSSKKEENTNSEEDNNAITKDEDEITVKDTEKDPDDNEDEITNNAVKKEDENEDELETDEKPKDNDDSNKNDSLLNDNSSNNSETN